MNAGNQITALPLDLKLSLASAAATLQRTFDKQERKRQKPARVRLPPYRSAVARGVESKAAHAVADKPVSVPLTIEHYEPGIEYSEGQYRTVHGSIIKALDGCLDLITATSFATFTRALCACVEAAVPWPSDNVNRWTTVDVCSTAGEWVAVDSESWEKNKALVIAGARLRCRVVDMPEGWECDGHRRTGR